jgi:hypothetical protein
MTKTELIALSTRVAEKLGGIEPYHGTMVIEELHPTEYAKENARNYKRWLHENSEQCFELSITFEIEPRYWSNTVGCYRHGRNVSNCEISDFDDTFLATRVAILKALEAM